MYHTILITTTGGNTGVSETANEDNDKIDCRGRCDGKWVIDECNEQCVPPDRGEYGSIFKDCHETCHQPGK